MRNDSTFILVRADVSPTDGLKAQGQGVDKQFFLRAIVHIRHPVTGVPLRSLATEAEIRPPPPEWRIAELRIEVPAIFDGRDDSGALLPDGTYPYDAEVSFLRKDNIPCRGGPACPPSDTPYVKIIDSDLVQGNTIEIDTTPPRFDTLSPENGFVSAIPSAVISGVLSEPATLTINEIHVPLSLDHSFSLTTSLQPGDNLFTLLAEDAAGNQTTQVLRIIFDNIPPVISIVEPEAGSFLSNPRPTIQVTYTDCSVIPAEAGIQSCPSPGGSGVDLSTLSIFLDGEILSPPYLKHETLETIFVPPFPLPEGPHTLTASISDRARNRGEAEPVTFTVDVTPPILTVKQPPPECVAPGFTPGGETGSVPPSCLTNQSPTPISGTVNEEGTVTINGIPTPLVVADGIFVFDTTTPLSEGENIVEIIATDRAGNRATKERHPTLDTTPPVVTVDQPPPSCATPSPPAGGEGGGEGNCLTNQNPFLVRGSVNEPSIVRVNGIPVDLTSGAAGDVAVAFGFPQPSITLDPGGETFRYNFNTNEFRRFFVGEGEETGRFAPGNFTLIREEGGRLRVQANLENLSETNDVTAQVTSLDTFPAQDFSAKIEVFVDPSSMGAYDLFFNFGLATDEGFGGVGCSNKPAGLFGPFPPGSSDFIAECRSSLINVGSGGSSRQLSESDVLGQTLVLEIGFNLSSATLATKVTNKATGEVLFQGTDGPVDLTGKFELLFAVIGGTDPRFQDPVAGHILSFWDNFESTLTTPPGYVALPTCLSFDGQPFCDVPGNGGFVSGGFIFLAGPGPGGVVGVPTRVPADGVTDLNAALVEAFGGRLTVITTLSQAQIVALVREADPFGMVRAFLPAILRAPTAPGSNYLFTPPSTDPPPDDGISQFAIPISLSEGLNTLTVHAVDLATNAALPITRTITLDSIPPVLSLHYPPQNVAVNFSPLLIHGSVSEFSAVLFNDTIPLPLQSPLLAPEFAPNFGTPSLTPGPVVPLIDDFSSGLTPRWEAGTIYGPEGVILAEKGAVTIDTLLRSRGSLGNSLMLQAGRTGPATAHSGFTIQTEFKVEVLQGSAGFGLALVEAPPPGSQAVGRIEQSVLNVALGGDGSRLPVAFFRTITPEGAQSAQGGLLTSVGVGDVLTLTLAYKPFESHTLEARISSGDLLLFLHQVQNVPITFPIVVQIQATTTELNAIQEPLTADSRVRVVVDNVLSDLNMREPYSAVFPPVIYDGVAYMDILSRNGEKLSEVEGAVLDMPLGGLSAVTTAGQPVAGIHGAQNINLVILELPTVGARITVYTTLSCAESYARFLQFDSQTLFQYCTEPMLAAKGAGMSYQLSGFVGPTALNFRNFVPLDEGENTFLIRAIDSAGNSSNPVLITAFYDPTPPTASLEVGIEGFRARFSSVGGTVRFGDVGAGIDPGGVFLLLDGLDVTPSFSDSGQFDFLISATDGWHTLIVVVRDRAGNQTASEAITFLVDTSAPSIWIERPTPAEVIATTNVRVRIGFSDPLSGIDPSSLLVRLDDTVIPNPPTIGGAADFYVSASDGTHRLTAAIADQLGNVSKEASVVFFVDTALCDFSLIGSTEPASTLAATRPFRQRDPLAGMEADGMPPPELFLGLPGPEDRLSLLGAPWSTLSPRGIALGGRDGRDVFTLPFEEWIFPHDPGPPQTWGPTDLENSPHTEQERRPWRGASPRTGPCMPGDKPQECVQAKPVGGKTELTLTYKAGVIDDRTIHRCTYMALDGLDGLPLMRKECANQDGNLPVEVGDLPPDLFFCDLDFAGTSTGGGSRHQTCNARGEFDFRIPPPSSEAFRLTAIELEATGEFYVGVTDGTLPLPFIGVSSPEVIGLTSRGYLMQKPESNYSQNDPCETARSSVSPRILGHGVRMLWRSEALASGMTPGGLVQVTVNPSSLPPVHGTFSMTVWGCSDNPLSASGTQRKAVAKLSRYNLYAIYECDPDSPKSKDKVAVKVSATQSDLLPDHVPGGPEESTIQVQVTSACGNEPAKGKTVNFEVKPVDGSGGHAHTNGRDQEGHKGSLSQSSCTTGENGRCSVTYTASELSGREKIIATVGESKGETTITVQVPGLEPLGGGTGIELVGQTPAHSSNHFGTVFTIQALQEIGAEFTKLEGNPNVQVNDISLPLGGLFDINGNWTTPHKSHRTGEDVDIRIPADVEHLVVLREAIRNSGCDRLPEPDHWHLRCVGT